MYFINGQIFVDFTNFSGRDTHILPNINHFQNEILSSSSLINCRMDFFTKFYEGLNFIYKEKNI